MDQKRVDNNNKKIRDTITSPHYLLCVHIRLIKIKSIIIQLKFA
jgi:hypothetical protein